MPEGGLTKGISAPLFLDFDGVMHPEHCSIDQYFCNLPLLEAWLRARPDVGVVISSSWREMHPFDEMQSYFSEDPQHRILGATPVARREAWAQLDGELLPIRFEREAEVLRWLRESDAPLRPWVALDDQPWLYRPFCQNLVVCNRITGLTERQLKLVDTILSRR